jgi:hypothetical protein
MRPTRAHVTPERLPMSGIGTARRYPRKGPRREAPGENGSGGANGNDGGEGGNADPTTTDTDGKSTDTGKAPEITGDFDPERAAKALAAARDDAKKAKDDRTAILKALGVDNPREFLKTLRMAAESKENPEARLKELADENAKLREETTAHRLEKLVAAAAKKHEGDADMLLDSTTFAKKLAKLDPAAEDHADKVAALVQAEIKANPRFAKTAPAGIRGRGTDHTGGGGANRPQGLAAAVNNRFNS